MVARSLVTSSLLLAVLAPALTPSAASAQTLPELLVTRTLISDFEFDWGRDGVHCPGCNGGAGNARLTFTDGLYRLWVADVDPVTGAFVPANGRGTLVDTSAAPTAAFGNGPEWMNGPLGSQIVYTKYEADLPPTPQTAGLAVATQLGGGWVTNFLPGGAGGYAPLGSLDVDDPRPRIVYQSSLDNLAYWRYADEAVEALLPSQNTVCARRWVAGAPAVIYTAPCLYRPRADAQVYWYDVTTGVEHRLTADDGWKLHAFAWRAPEFGNDYALLTVADRTMLRIYRQPAEGPLAGEWTLVNTIAAPSEAPYITSPEPFVHNGQSYVVMQLGVNRDRQNYTSPSHLGLTGIDPAVPSMRLLTNDDSVPRLRIDPEYYITAQGPFIYYMRFVAATATSPAVPEGVWRVDTGLGPAVPPP